MQNLNKKVFIVFPKCSSYVSKDITVQIFYQNKCMEWLEFFKNLGLSIRCFAEDFLALQLYKDRDDLDWVTLVSQVDSGFIQKYIDEVPFEYKQLSKLSDYNEYIKQSLSYVKTPKVFNFNGDEEAYWNSRMLNINKRIRYVADKVLNESNVIYFGAKNNYCSEPRIQIGDGRFVVNIDVGKGLEQHYYGGMLLQKDAFKQVLGGIYGK